MWCWHKWMKVPLPEGWVLTEFDYRKCAKCGEYQAKGPPYWAANFWQKIQVPAPHYKTRGRK